MSGRFRPITVEMVEYVAHTLAVKTMAWNEPIPEFGTRFPGILESCLAAPFQSYGGRALYKGLAEKAAALFYLMIKNHPFQNGNKRLAVTSLLIFLNLNGRWLKASAKQLYEFAVWVAESRPEFKDLTTLGIKEFIESKLAS